MVGRKAGHGEMGQNGEVGQEILEKRFWAKAGELGQKKNEQLTQYWVFCDPQQGLTLGEALANYF